MEQGQSWARSLSMRIGQRIAHLRDRPSDAQRRKLTTQALAERTAELGHPLDRSVIAKLEKGHRQSITVPELLVLAAALEMPPAHLLLPLGETQDVEILPGKTVPTAEALAWLCGEHALTPSEVWKDSATTVAQYKMHFHQVRAWRETRDRVRWFRGEAREFDKGNNPEQAQKYERDAQDAQEAADRTWDLLRQLRTAMRAGGLTLPELPPELARREEASS